MAKAKGKKAAKTTKLVPQSLQVLQLKMMLFLKLQRGGVRTLLLLLGVLRIEDLNKNY